MGKIKDLLIQLESAIETKELYENAIEPNNYSLRIDALTIEIFGLKNDLMSEIQKL